MGKLFSDFKKWIKDNVNSDDIETKQVDKERRDKFVKRKIANISINNSSSHELDDIDRIANKISRDPVFAKSVAVNVIRAQQ